jgi:4-hydroxyphenylpyruvate dioxygenase
MHRHADSKITGIDYIEIYVSNCTSAAHYYRTALGFDVLGQVEYSADADRASMVVQQGNVRLLLTAPRTASSDVAAHLEIHGEGVRDVALSVTSVDQVFESAIAWSALPLQPPAARSAAGESFRVARIAPPGGAVVHSLIECAPGSSHCAFDLSPGDAMPASFRAGLVGIDHLALAVPAGELDRQAAFYVAALGFKETHQEDVTTEYSAMRSKVVQTPDGAVRLPIMEPAVGRRQSQIDSYIHAHDGAGVQHLAFRSDDIVASAAAIADGVTFLPTPDAYYERLEARVGPLADEMPALRHHGILVDRDSTGLLLQVFTRPIGPRPTLFLEVIERRGANGFGGGNIKALFQAVERADHADAALSS